MYKFTSESVSEGHPDKVADLISDRIADFILDGNINNRTAIETLVTTNMVTVAGEYKSTKTITNNDVEEIVKQVVKEIGYDCEIVRVVREPKQNFDHNPYNLYVNKLIDRVSDGWYVVVDDDDEQV